MEYTKLGRTGLTVSVAGLGCGGNSRIGQGAGMSTAQSVGLVREARDLGVTFFDTAEAYGTEEILGAAISPGERASVVISTKSRISRGGEPMPAADVVANLDASLRRLKTDYVDVFLLHGVAPAAYERCREELAPALLRERDKGKVRHLGLSETSPNDPEQKMLQRALGDRVWEVMMLAFHMLNQGARRDVFPRTKAQGVGTLLMFVVRNIFSRPGLLARTMKDLAADAKVPAELAARDNPLDFLVHPGGAESLIDAAYRFARHQPGADVVLFGTSSSAHLHSNIASILRPPLPAADLQRLYDTFGALRGVGLDLPDRSMRR
jgi:aryl-alcohol dehydrogenase-like predicted oxidoreductase